MSSRGTQILKRATVMLGILIIPLLYSYLYLGAFWDPYSRLSDLPIAIVNEDDGALINNENRNLGNEMVDRLQEDGSLNFVVTTLDSATSGTELDTYYAMIVIPEDFSSDIASAETTDKTSATITFSANEKKNYLASQIMSRAIVEMEESLRDQVSSEIVANLSSQLGSVPASLNDLSAGITELQDGSDTLSLGAADLSTGMDTVTSGASSLEEGADALSAGADSVSDGAQDVNTGAQGLATGAAQLAAGTNGLLSGSSSLATNLQTLTDKMNTFNQGMSASASGGASLYSGAVSLDNGIDSLLSGVQTLEASTQGLGQLSTSTATLQSAVQSFASNLTSYTDSIDTLITSSQNTTAYLEYYTTYVDPSLMDDPDFAAFMAALTDPSVDINLDDLSSSGSLINQGAAMIQAGADMLATKTSNLADINTALTQIENGLVSVKQGSQSLVNGSQTLSSGLNQLSSGSSDAYKATQLLTEGALTLSQGVTSVNTGATSLSLGASTLAQGTSSLSTGATEVSDGAQTLSGGALTLRDGIGSAARGAQDVSDGAKALGDGITQLQNAVSDSASDAAVSTAALDGLSDFAASSVQIESTPIDSVSNYGTAFAPYFLSLSLWVGGLMIFLGTFLDSDGKFAILSKNSDKKIARSFIYLGLGIVQAMVLGVLIQTCLGLSVAHPVLYYMACCLFSLVSVSIIQFFMIHLKDIGKFASILLLILQLTSCGGTFPMETVPKIFNVLYPFMPMTYAVRLLKEAISGGDKDIVMQNAIILVLIAAAFLAATIILTRLKNKKEKRLEVSRVSV